MFARGIQHFLPWSRRRRFDILFYAQSWIDETWMRSTILECCRRGFACGVVSDGPADRQDCRRLTDAGVTVVESADAGMKRRLQARIMVSASSGVRRDAFSGEVGLRVHMPHSIVSLHMIYAEDSFDGFDVLFAVGPHHVREFEALSVRRGLTGRRSYAIGYGKADLLPDGDAAVSTRADPYVVVAPSWGPNGLLPQAGRVLIGALLRAGMRVTLRPHPLHILGGDPACAEIRNAFGSHPLFTEESPDVAPESMRTADVLITDYSGTAFEFALSRNRPVIFVDVPKKVMNPAWESLGLAPVEVGLRDRIGMIVPPEADAVVAAVGRACLEAGPWRQRIADATGQFLFRRQGCARVAADALEGLMQDARHQTVSH